MDKLCLFVVREVAADTNNLSGFKYDSSCSYSKSGDCQSCCSMELVKTP